jgi:hypothetical protein
MMMTLDDFFQENEQSGTIFEAIRSVIDTIGPTEMRVSKSQIAFWRRKAVARIWLPVRYLKGGPAPLVLTLGFRYRDTSPRWKEIAEPTPGRFTHHLELHSIDDLDLQVRDWLRDAWQNAA